MGFPVGYPEVLLPTILLHVLSLLAFLRSLILSLFSLLRLTDLLDLIDPDVTSAAPESHYRPTLSALLIREFLPVVRYLDLAGDPSVPTGCAVCLGEFSEEEEIRCMKNCRHIFHSACVDRWIDHDQKTCPLCRTHFVPHQKMDDYNQRLWSASLEDEGDDVDLFSQRDDNSLYTTTISI